MVSGAITGTRRVERCVDEVPWSPVVCVSTVSSRSPIRAVRSLRSREFDAPPRTIFTIEASQIAAAALSPHRCRA